MEFVRQNLQSFEQILLRKSTKEPSAAFAWVGAVDLEMSGVFAKAR
jgi:hypothetical protein